MMIENTAYNEPALRKKQVIAFIIYLCRLSFIANIPSSQIEHMLSLLTEYYDIKEVCRSIRSCFASPYIHNTDISTEIMEIWSLYTAHYDKFKKLITYQYNTIQKVYNDFEKLESKYKTHQINISEYKEEIYFLLCKTISDLSQNSNISSKKEALITDSDHKLQQHNNTPDVAKNVHQFLRHPTRIFKDLSKAVTNRLSRNKSTADITSTDTPNTKNYEYTNKDTKTVPNNTTETEAKRSIDDTISSSKINDTEEVKLTAKCNDACTDDYYGNIKYRCTKEKVQLLKKLWLSGVPAYEITRQIFIPKDIVVEIAQKLNLPAVQYTGTISGEDDISDDDIIPDTETPSTEDISDTPSQPENIMPGPKYRATAAWSSETIEELEKLWLSGMSAREISKKLNISKNAIIGKVHRLKLPMRESPIIKATEYTTTEADSVENNSNLLSENEIIEFFIAKYNKDGVISENELYNTIAENGISIFQTNNIVDNLLSRGVIIKDGNPRDLTNNDSKNKSNRYPPYLREVLTIEPQLKHLIDYIAKIEFIKKGERVELLKQAKNGNKWAFNRLFNGYLRSVVFKALNAHKKYNTPIEDAIQAGCIGLMRAIEKFDVTEGEAFATYSSYAINSFIDRQADFAPNRIIYYPPHVRAQMNKIYSMVENHVCPSCPNGNKFICPALLEEIISELECSEDDAKQYLLYFTPTTSISEMTQDIGCECDLEGRVMYKNLCSLIQQGLSTLKPREHFVINKRFGLNGEPETSLEDVGKIFSVTRERVRQIEAVALRKLKHPSRLRKLKNYLGSSLSEN